MEVILAIPILLLVFCWPLVSGLMAISFGRKFWFWFLVGIPLPFVAAVILLFLPNKRKKPTPTVSDEMRAVPNEEIFNHLTVEAVTNHQKIKNEIHFSASA